MSDLFLSDSQPVTISQQMPFISYNTSATMSYDDTAGIADDIVNTWTTSRNHGIDMLQ